MNIKLKRFTQARLVRWRNELQYFHFNVEYIKEKDNVIPDALTLLAEMATGKNECLLCGAIKEGSMNTQSDPGEIGHK